MAVVELPSASRDLLAPDDRAPDGINAICSTEDGEAESTKSGALDGLDGGPRGTKMRHLFETYDEGLITRGELFGMLLGMLTPENYLDARAALASRPGWTGAFLPWLESVANRTGTVAGGMAMNPSEAAVSAVQSWLDGEVFARTKREVVLSTEPECHLPSGIDVLLVHDSESEGLRWFIELVGEARETLPNARVEVDLSQLDLTPWLEEDNQRVEAIQVVALPDRPRDVAVATRSGTATGSRHLPREEAA